MHYLNFHHYFSPWLPLFLLIYFLVCFPQAVLFACIFPLPLLAAVVEHQELPSIFQALQAQLPWAGGGMRQKSLGKMWPRHSRDKREPVDTTSSFSHPSLTQQGLRGSSELHRARIPAQGGQPFQGLAWHGCRKAKHQPAMPWQSQQGQRLAAHRGAGCLQAMPELIPEPVWPL